MDWVSIITAVGGVLSGGGVMAILNWRANKRKAEAEAKQAEAEASRTEAEGKSMIFESENHFIDQLQEQQDKYLQVFAGKDKKIDELYDKLRRSENKVILCANNICVHHGCECRLPGRGLGLKWVDGHGDEPDLGGDYDTCEELMVKYRSRKREENGDD
ncbi:MAG: hypothetical protein ACOXZ6_12665 [Syntrophomonadaceae bacterium]|jgi:Rieske Fe-S protein